MTHAAISLAMAAELAEAVANVEQITASATQRGAFNYDAPLPPLNIRPTQNLWEPAAVHYRDLEEQP